MRLVVLRVVREKWETQEVRLAVEQAKDAARRIGKKVDIRQERIRFSRACESIENMARKNADSYFEIEGREAFEFMKYLPMEGEISLPFISSLELESMANKVKIGERRLRKDSGLVAFPVSFGDPPDALKLEADHSDNGRKPPDFSECSVTLEAVVDDEVLHRFHKDLRVALEKNECLGMGGYRHETFVKGVREYLNVRYQKFETRKERLTKEVPDEEAIAKREAKLGYRLKKLFLAWLLPKDVPKKTISFLREKRVPVPVEPVLLRIAFLDGSEGEPFPLFCLPMTEKPSGLKTVRAAIISARHFELDSHVDLYVLRNSEFSRREDESFADQERLAFTKAKKVFSSFITKKPGTKIYLYHTGLEPAVIGTYRAIVEILRWPENRGRLVVTPKLFHGNRYITLESWY